MAEQTTRSLGMEPREFVSRSPCRRCEAGSGSFDVAWAMDFDGYEGSAGNHQYLTEIAFKAFTSI